MVLLLLIGFSLPGVLSQGDRLYYSSARSLGIGGVSEVLEYGDNPASLSIPDNPFILLSGALLRASEKRGLRVYDSYGNNMGISTIADNASLYSGLGSSAIILPFKAFGLGFKYTPLWDFHYRYRFESRDDFYQVVRIEENDYNGSIDGLGPMAGVNLGIVRLGVEATYLVGRKNDETKIILPQAEDSIRQTFVRYHGYTSKMGVLVIPTSQFRFSYSIRFKYTMAADEGDGLDYPICHSFGCMYQPPSRLPTRLFLELDYEAWTDPVLVYKFGIEHAILTSYAIRYGFTVFPDYGQNAVWTTVLTLGLGLNTGRYYFDLGFGYGKRDYSNADFGGLDQDPENLRFDEATGHFVISCGLTL